VKSLTVSIPIIILIFLCSLTLQSHAAIVEVTVIGFSFSPNSVTIYEGDTVTWKNLFYAHTTTSGTSCTPDGKWDSSYVDTFSRIFNEAGTYPYFCIAHCNHGMTGVIIVIKDNIVPVITGFTLPATSDSLTVSIISFTATDNAGVTGYMVTESSNPPSATAAGWSNTPQTTYAFNSEGTKTLFAWAKDAAGNVSAGKSAAVIIALNHMGDINSDLTVNLQDAIIVLQILTRLNPDVDYSKYLASGADVDGDNKMGFSEVIYILQKVAGFR